MVEKVLNVVVKEELGTNRLQGIKLPKFHKQQLIAQYVDDKFHYQGSSNMH
jgi:hypothetical protein